MIAALISHADQIGVSALLVGVLIGWAFIVASDGLRTRRSARELDQHYATIPTDPKD